MAQEGEDCYFYYYSTCRKGPSCPFRHEPSSRGTEAVCEDWEFGRCLKDHCGFRHMRIQVNRSTIACYWESQPTGCQRPHCMFRHSEVRNIPTVAPTQVEETSVPSPKVDQILIHVADTDEDSPQKAQSKPAVAKRGLAKRIHLKHVDKTADKPNLDLEENQRTSAKNSSQFLEDELLEIAKQGICLKSGSEVTKTISNSNSPVKGKSVKDIKREKILKARLEYQRKKLLASLQAEVNGDALSMPAAKVRKVTEARSASQMTNLSSNRRTAKAKNADQPITTSNLHNTTKTSLQQKPSELEVSGTVASSAAKVRVKSFSEIMEEKRRRRGEEMSPSGHGDTKESNGGLIKKPVIAARKIRLNQSVNRKPIRLKRAAPSEAEVRPAVSVKGHNDKEQEIDTSKAIDSVPYPHVDTTSNETQSMTDVKPASVDDSPNLDLDEEFDLLDGSDYFKSDAPQIATTSSDIDDDDFMNEMEQLLA